MRGGIWFRPIPVAVAACVVVVALVLLARNDSPRARAWARGLIAVSVVAILGVTLRGGSSGTGASNLVPGRTIVAGLTSAGPLGLFNLVGNVAMFVPLGWLLALVAARRRLVVAGVAGVALSVSIELVQSLIGRVSDVDDVILNGSGAVLGASVALLIRAGRPASKRSASLSEGSRN